MIETVYDLREALIAVQACKDAAPIPILVTFSFHTVDKGGRTVMGNSVNDIVKALVANGVTALAKLWLFSTRGSSGDYQDDAGINYSSADRAT